jgi:hypothetical protein
MEETMKSLIAVNSSPPSTALAALAFLLAATLCCAGQNPSQFSNLQKHINGHVTVDTNEGPVTGQLLRADENRIVVYEGATPKPIARESVKRVTKHNSRHTAAWIAGMSAAGLGAGLLIGMRSFDDATYANKKVGGMAGAGAGAGAAAGYALSRSGKHDQVIYQFE